MSNHIVIVTPAYERRLGEIEDFIYESTARNVLSIEKFLDEHDRVINFIKENPGTPSLHPEVGHRSWPFGDGRYRLFFKISGNKIHLLDLIDNRMSNQKIYPGNSIPTYEED